MRRPLTPRILALLGCLIPSVGLAAKPDALSPTQCLRKAAFDLVERAPTREERAAVESGQTPYVAVVAGYLDSEACGQVGFNWYRTLFSPTRLTPAEVDWEEPARLGRFLLTHDLDLRELVTARYTVDTGGNQIPLEGDRAGVIFTRIFLSSFQGLHWRSFAANVLRKLADVRLIPSTVVPEGQDPSRAGLAANPVCASCHIHPVFGIDPLAVLHDCFDGGGFPIAGCKKLPTRFLGQPVSTLTDLGQVLAGSEEFRASTIRFYFARLFGRPLGSNETAFYWRIRDQWADGGYRSKVLLRALLTSPEYCSQ